MNDVLVNVWRGELKMIGMTISHRVSDKNEWRAKEVRPVFIS